MKGGAREASRRARHSVGMGARVCHTVKQIRRECGIMSGMRTMERSRGKTAASDRKVTCIAVTYQGLSPFDALDYRIREAMDAATVRRMGDGTFRASTPCLDPFYSEGRTRKDALADLWESCRWLLADPVRISFEAAGRTFIAEVLAERYGGYSVSVPEIPGCNTCGDTMDEVRHNVVEAAELMLESNSTLT